MKNQFGVERKPILNNAISQFLVSSNFFTKRIKKLFNLYYMKSFVFKIYQHSAQAKSNIFCYVHR